MYLYGCGLLLLILCQKLAYIHKGLQVQLSDLLVKNGQKELLFSSILSSRQRE